MTDSNGATTQRGRALLALREMILQGTLPPGKRMEEVELGQQLGISRPILRTVLDALASEGLLELTPSGGYLPRHFKLDDIRDSILARSTLEGLAASLAASRLPQPSELEAARRINTELSQVIPVRPSGHPTPEEMARFGELNAAFHRALVELARSPMLSWYVQRLETVAFASPAAVVLPAESDGALRAYEQHEAILQAIEARDASRAEALVREHAYLAIHEIERASEGQPHSGRNIALNLMANKPSKPPGARRDLPPKRRGAASGTTSDRMLDAAAELFCEKGFHAATTRELANRLHVQQASLYHHISNKEDLLNRICSRTIDSFLADLPAALKQADGSPHRIGAFIEAHLRTTLRDPYGTRALATEFRALSRPHFTELAHKYRAYSQLLDSELESARKAGILRSDIPQKYMRLELLNILNWTPRWFRPTGALSLSEVSSIYERIFWEGIVPANAGQTVPVRPLPPSSGRPRSRDAGRGTLAKVVRGAAELFARQGYKSTSTRNLASLLGIEKATIYYHLDGKEDLLYTICKSSIEQLSYDVNVATEAIENPLEKLQVWIQAHLVNLLSYQTQHATALAEVRSLSEERLAEIVGMRKSYQTRIRSVIEAGQESGHIRTDVASKYLGLMLEGLLDRVVIWYRRRGELTPAELAETFCSLFVTGAQRRS